LGRLFRRYAAHHLRLSVPGLALRDTGDGPAGRVDRIVLRHDRLAVEGRLAASVAQVSLLHGGRRRSMAPEPWPGGPGFRLELPYAPGPAVIETLSAEGRAASTPLPALSPLRLWTGRILLLPGFAWRACRTVPAVLRWFRFHDPVARDEVRQAFGLGLVETAHPLDPALFGPPAPVPALSAAPGFCVILPVYQAFDLVQACLDRLARHTDLPWRLILLDDASPDPRIAPFLRAFAEGRPAGQVTLVHNDRNLGFIGTVNRGLALARQQGPDGAPVVLLNSDALVPPGWASRLLAPMLADPDTVASVTPMSNDAELACVPAICARHDLAPGEAEAIDRAAAALPAGQGLAEAPTGVGFCMALNPRFLDREPRLDPAFGRGYGEEVDWCQKVAAWGGRHLYQPRLFVEHHGGGSFGSEEKRRLLQKNGALISARHPRFDAEVQQFLAEDPLLTPRLALGLALAAHRAAQVPGDSGRVPVYLAHAMGGGAEAWLQQRIAQVVGGKGSAVVLRVGGDRRWRIELHMAPGVTWAETGDTALMQRLIGLMPARRMVYSCGVGDRDPAGLPEVLLALAQGPAHAVEVLFHDYFPISPSYTLLDGSGRWRGLPDPATTDRAHQWRRPDGSRIGLADWQAAWGRLLARAEAVEVFSQASRALVTATWPDVSDRVAVRHHAVHPVPRLPGPTPGARPVIGVLGNIGAHKGAALLSAISRRLARHPLRPGLAVIGNVDPAYRLARRARIHGSYDLADLPALVQRYGITCWLIPSVWPEAFSYTTREALATGLPVWCLDLGAQAEAVTQAVAAGAAGGVVPLRDGTADPDELLAQILGPVAKGQA
jgi:GT2 family glycosyltransferase